MRPTDANTRLKRSEWDVVEAPLASAQYRVEQQHYAGGGSNTAVYVHGLIRRDDPMTVRGFAWWLPPTGPAAESVLPGEAHRVLALTRLVIDPDVPANAASFLMARAIRAIRHEGKWRALVTYADESQGHTGAIYLACGWSYMGRTAPTPRWVDAEGRQRSPKATSNRTKSEMEALGYQLIGRYSKHKFVMLLDAPRSPTGRNGQIPLFGLAS